ncbi:50S ribosomal protein L23 [Candidatus Pacearchaeota archaeon]|nr:50S ribosomal protein L23 [Candidatus Pacearchaeota archaeon]
MILKPITSEKAVKLIDMENTLLFQVERQIKKDEIKREVESLFSVKVSAVRTHTRGNRKFAYVKLVKTNPAIDVATKIGVI